jgi:hypothetical protein
MRLNLIAAALAALVLPGLAAAKEPTHASISGPGFHKALTMREGPGYESTPLGRLTMDSGFFPSAVGQSPDPMLHARPAGPLGPRYRIVWTVPAGATHLVAQDVYPYAKHGAVAYTRPGQPIFDSRTIGGWYRNPELKRTLVSLGLPVRAARGGDGTNYGLVAGLGIPGAVAVAGVAVLVARRRR